MSKVIVKIEIQESVYKRWDEFDKDGVAMVKQQLRIDFRNSCQSLGIEDADIEVYEED